MLRRVLPTNLKRGADMCFQDDDIDHDDQFWRGDDDKPISDKAKSYFDDLDWAEEFCPNESFCLFGCTISQTELQLALALLSKFKSVESACNVLKAANALRELTGLGPVVHSEQTMNWNAQHQVGQMVQVWPIGLNGESFLTRTTTVAFDTAAGPCVLVADDDKAVPLTNVQPRQIDSPEVSP
jgi:hypothetical protein